jgi:aryl-alcohol dehydrogenase-like predicted oxidoreductase
MIGDFVRKSRLRDQVIISTKIPPMNFHWPAVPDVAADEVFPAHHIRTHTEESLRNLRVDTIDILHLHVWADHFVNDDAWWETMQALKKEGKIRFVGVALNSFDPDSGLSLIAKERVDVIQVHYNVFEQRPADHLLQAASEAGVGVVARSPFEEGLLTGKFHEETRFSPDDFRAVYFVADRLKQTVERVDDLRPVLEKAAGSMASGAVRFCLSAPEVCTVIPGIRSVTQAEDDSAGAHQPSLGSVRQRVVICWGRGPPQTHGVR